MAILKWCGRGVCIIVSTIIIAAIFFILWSNTNSRIEQVQSSFDGIGSVLKNKQQKRDLIIFILHGIGEHCIGYSDRLFRGIIEQAGITAPSVFDETLEKLRDRVQEEALAFVERYRIKGALPQDTDKDLVRHLRLLAMRIAAGDIALADDLKDLVDSDPGTERDREADTALDLQVLVKYGLIGSGCGHLPLPQSVPLTDFDAQDLARVNTCVAISRFTGVADSDCRRLTLDFYDSVQLTELAKKKIVVPLLPPPRCREHGPPPVDATCAKVTAVDLGFLLSRTLMLSQDDGSTRFVRLYELTWDPATRWAKEQYTSHDAEFDRDLVNQRLKVRVINDSISDAVMYLGNSRPLIQFPLLAALCKILTDRRGEDDAAAASLAEDEFRCARSDLPAVNGEAFAEANELVILTHSLGTRVLLDTLGSLGRPKFIEELAEGLRVNNAYVSPPEVQTIIGHLEQMRIALMGSLRKIFVMTNQIPLLEMASLSGPFISQSPILDPRDLGRYFDTFLEARASFAAEPLQLVAFTDSNDLLSYSLRCWYQRHVLRKNVGELLKRFQEPGVRRSFVDSVASCRPPDPDDTPINSALRDLWQQVEHKVRIAEVFVQLRSLRIRGIFTEPSGVHSKYFDDDLVNKLIACGAREGANDPLSCTDY